MTPTEQKQIGDVKGIVRGGAEDDGSSSMDRRGGVVVVVMDTRQRVIGLAIVLIAFLP